MEKGYLLLSDGQLYQGMLFGATDICCGELTDVVLKVHDGHPNIADMIRAHKVDLVINTPMGFHSRRSDDEIRSEAMRAKVPYTTTTSAASAAVEAIKYLERKEHIVRELPDRR